MGEGRTQAPGKQGTEADANVTYLDEQGQSTTPRSDSEGHPLTQNANKLRQDFDQDINASSYGTGITDVSGADQLRVNTEPSGGSSGQHEVVVTWYDEDGNIRLQNTFGPDTENSLNLLVKGPQVDVAVNDTSGAANNIRGLVQTV